MAFHLKIDADPDPAYHCDADPDPTFQSDTDPDSQHCVEQKEKSVKTESCTVLLLRVSINKEAGRNVGERVEGRKGWTE